VLSIDCRLIIPGWSFAANFSYAEDVTLQDKQSISYGLPSCQLLSPFRGYHCMLARSLTSTACASTSCPRLGQTKPLTDVTVVAATAVTAYYLIDSCHFAASRQEKPQHAAPTAAVDYRNHAQNIIKQYINDRLHLHRHYVTNTV